MRIVTLVAGAILLGVPAFDCAVAETLRIARGLGTGNRGNPFSSAGNANWDLYSAIFDSLTRVTGDGELIPWAAERWEESASSGWVFTLRPRLSFSNGEPFDADAVAETIAYLRSEAGQREAGASRAAGIQSVRVLDAHRIEIVPTVPDPLLPQRLSTLWIVAPRAWRDTGRDAFAAAPIGSGPYRVTAWAANSIKLEAVPSSWRRAPSDELELLLLPDPPARNALLAAKRADIAIGSLDAETARAHRESGGTVYMDQLPAVIGVAFNTVRDARFRDVRVRQALNYAVDKERIAHIFLDGAGRPPSQVGRSGFFGFNASVAPYSYDPDRARRLLAEAGYEDGFTFDMELASGGSLWDSIFIQVASDLKAVGFQMSIRMSPTDVIQGHIQSGTWRGSAWGAPMFSAAFDALEPLRQHSCLWHAPWFCDEAMMPAIQEAMAAPDVDSRRAATERVMASSHDRAQALFVYESVGFIGVGPRVKNFRSDFGFLRYEMMEVE